jgi:hypothetical protein
MTPKPFLQFDVSAFDWFLSDVADHYERTSPVVIIWLDAVADSLRDGTVTLAELRKVQTLVENDIWLDPHGAGNLAYKQLSQSGKLPANVTLAF